MTLFSNRSYIDEGKNPELYSKHQLEQTLAKYQAVDKKVEAYKVTILITLPSHISPESLGTAQSVTATIENSFSIMGRNISTTDKQQYMINNDK